MNQKLSLKDLVKEYGEDTQVQFSYYTCGQRGVQPVDASLITVTKSKGVKTIIIDAEIN